MGFPNTSGPSPGPSQGRAHSPQCLWHCDCCGSAESSPNPCLLWLQCPSRTSKTTDLLVSKLVCHNPPGEPKAGHSPLRGGVPSSVVYNVVPGITQLQGAKVPGTLLQGSSSLRMTKHSDWNSLLCFDRETEVGSNHNV